ncbi:hypothetical protein K4L44_04970 [Halosquirtibacter laminarini]|uniref:Uncharacterized protein n=1 Tax=Halosquirtibacter laminarini TaxID=3374600 RepID=A0AC61NI19_9BACT|nr:hypothetical protein K4L44_04970 [Prolixibacteraceae bacterium]
MKTRNVVDFRTVRFISCFGLNTDCPKCQSEDAFYNGACYECPSCGYEWS